MPYIWPADEDQLTQLDNLTDAGGTIGPLPDGTVIEVAPISYADIADRAGLDRAGIMRGEFDRAEILDAYNRSQEA